MIGDPNVDAVLWVALAGIVALLVALGIAALVQNLRGSRSSPGQAPSVTAEHADHLT